MSQILVSSQIHPARCKPPSQNPIPLLQPAQVPSSDNLAMPLLHAVTPRKGDTQVTKKRLGASDTGIAASGIGGLHKTLIFQLSLRVAVERGGSRRGPPRARGPYVPIMLSVPLIGGV